MRCPVHYKALWDFLAGQPAASLRTQYAVLVTGAAHYLRWKVGEPQPLSQYWWLISLNSWHSTRDWFRDSEISWPWVPYFSMPDLIFSKSSTSYGDGPLAQRVLSPLLAALLACVLSPANTVRLWKIVAGKELALLHCWLVLMHFVSQPQHHTPKGS